MCSRQITEGEKDTAQAKQDQRITMACSDVDMDIHRDHNELLSADRRELPVVHCYEATELVPDVKGPLHNLLQKEPAVLGSLQVVSGFLSVGVGIVFAFTQDMTESLFTMFRVSHLTGLVVIIAGVFSNLLSKYPALLPLSFRVNCSCIIVAVAAVCLTIVDLTKWNEDNEKYLWIEVLALGVLGLEILLSTILCVWFFKERCAKSP